MKLIINNKEINQQGNEIYLIAEAGVNHGGDIELAKEMIRKASEAGADAIKFQTYKAEKLASKNSPAYWDLSKEKSRSQYELFKKYDSFWEKEYKILAETCNDFNIDFLSTPFDLESAEFLNNLMPAFKIASADLTNTPLLRKIAKFGKPIILSTGASTIGEIDEAVRTIENEGNFKISLLHCILSYPTTDENANLKMIKHLMEVFPNYVIGYSDHTVPDPSLITLTSSVFMGARIIEKHFTLDKTLEGNDHYHAMDEQDIKRFKNNIKIFFNITSGSYQKKPLEVEKAAIKYARRSLVSTQDIPKGTILTEELITAKRPGTGISPQFSDYIIGRTTKMDIKADDLITWDMI